MGVSGTLRIKRAPNALDNRVFRPKSLKKKGLSAQKPYIIGSLGPKALTYKSFEDKAERPGGLMFDIALNP